MRLGDDPLDLWKELKTIIYNVELDVFKNANTNNLAAGKRLRKGLRIAKSIVGKLIVLTIEIDKVKRQVKKNRKKLKKSIIKNS